MRGGSTTRRAPLYMVRRVSRAGAAASWVAVAVGGILGTGLRLGIDVLLPHTPAQVPWSTIIVNTIGSFSLGILVAAVWGRVPDWLRAGLGAGLLGSFTTFSAVAVSAIAMSTGGSLATGVIGAVQPGDPALAAWFVVGSLFGGMFGALMGIFVGRLILRHQWRERRAFDDREDA